MTVVRPAHNGSEAGPTNSGASAWNAESGGAAWGAGNQITVCNGGTVIVAPGAVAFGVTLESGGEAVVSGNSDASGMIVADFVSAGGVEIVSSGGIALSSHLLSGGDEFVLSGAVASQTRVFSGGLVAVLASGTAVGALIEAGGTVEAFGTFVRSGTEPGPATLVGDVVYAGGLEVVASLGAFAVGTKIMSGGWQQVDPGGVASAVHVGSGGTAEVAGGGTWLAGTVVGGGLVVASGGHAAGVQIGRLGTVDVQTGATAEGLGFSGWHATAILGGDYAVGGATAPLSGLVPTDIVEFSQLGWVRGASAHFIGGSVLAVSAGGLAFAVTLDPAENLSALVPVAGSVLYSGHLVTEVTFHSATVPDGGAMIAELPTSGMLLAHS